MSSKSFEKFCNAKCCGDLLGIYPRLLIDSGDGPDKSHLLKSLAMFRAIRRTIRNNQQYHIVSFDYGLHLTALLCVFMLKNVTATCLEKSDEETSIMQGTFYGIDNVFVRTQKENPETDIVGTFTVNNAGKMVKTKTLLIATHPTQNAINELLIRINGYIDAVFVLLKDYFFDNSDFRTSIKSNRYDLQVISFFGEVNRRLAKNIPTPRVKTTVRADKYVGHPRNIVVCSQVEKPS